MKKFCFAIVAIAILAVGCANRAPSLTAITVEDFSDILGREWRLLEVHVNDTFGRTILFDRNTLMQEGDGDIFTMKFDEEMVSGTAAPNLYSGPFTLGEGNSLSIGMMRSTLMATLFEPERLPEHEFFGYMTNVHEWQFVDGRLVLLSKTEDDRDVEMIFGL
ncbi:MAG: META domain-containing protein [Treponema sp.]|nr:META domain-containing protein [Treponema sp.]